MISWGPKLMPGPISRMFVLMRGMSKDSRTRKLLCVICSAYATSLLMIAVGTRPKARPIHVNAFFKCPRFSGARRPGKRSIVLPHTCGRGCREKQNRPPAASSCCDVAEPHALLAQGQDGGLAGVEPRVVAAISARLAT